jgi:hypothetical protein
MDGLVKVPLATGFVIALAMGLFPDKANLLLEPTSILGAFCIALLCHQYHAKVD